MGVKPPRNRAFTIVVSVLVALASIPVLIIVAASGAPTHTVLAVILASVPVVPLVLFYLWLDRYEPEPRLLLALAMTWGAFVACFAAIVLEGVGGVVTGLHDNAAIAIVAPVVEEACKGFFLVMLLWWRRDELDGVLDGIVYAGLIGVGFAFTENILYLAAAYNGTDGVGPGGVSGLAGTFVVRCLLSPFAHPMFTAFTGIGVGLAVGSRSRWVRWLAPLGGYCVAVLAHATWNASTIFGFGSVVLVYLVLMLPAVGGLAAVAMWARRSERRMLALALGDAARRGLLPATDIGWVVDLGARRSARAYARRWGGPAGEHAMREYQQAAIELGFLHSRFLRGTPPPNFVARGQEYVARIGAVRPRIAFPGQVVPTR
ncbi:PrsW family intramembrane metalloprotease [Nocardioides sp. BP30]|uniref:PrsW family intramembrane metalloprotease n=1 Tax=Nocardioides sp. BP30 TaxID=3036374 RepID=UPI002469C426|nr:PrsW family intramembrane metalloprotease [Nocardioides sp. BP30]WGL51579.1 PrsW family intramembrane metalloprotease [Nocardioides sp. BP30]